ncbi:protein kinase domain-containing protein [Streptomyces sp. HMX87]|uniref:serine/threonine-protein kinase n=1 Tax=Streptomyces sp. HMX87 TaxID=3390849 RepID=UPI003A8AB5BF
MQTPGDVIDGRFELLERLGNGGMGTVWRALDTVLQREVALKAVRPDAEATDVVRERVLREARALARLNHPHVVTVHQVIEAGPHPWIVMELVPGVSLEQRLAQGPLTAREAARVGRQVLSALSVAHAAGVRHRDVKPANILLRADGTAVLTDFGIAALHGATALTATGELVGSPEYMAPERIRGRDDDPASDLWSLGLVLYVCAEGVNPLRRTTTLATLAAVLDDPVPPPVRSGPLAPALTALLVRDPAARPDAARLDAMLAQAESGAAAHWDRPTVTAGPAPAPAATPTQPDVPAPASWPDASAPAPRPDVPVPAPPRRLRRPVLAGVAVTAIAAAVAVALSPPWTGGKDGTGRATGGRTTGASTTPSPSPTPSTQPQSPDPEQGPARRPGPSAATSPSHSPAPATTAPPDGRDPSGRWIAQLHSEPVSSGTAARDRRLALVRATVPDARLLRSDDYASLRPGYWVVYAPGPFGDGRAALEYCAEHGRTTANTCLGRYLSRDPSDAPLQCRPPATNPTGRCVRNG